MHSIFTKNWKPGRHVLSIKYLYEKERKYFILQESIETCNIAYTVGVIHKLREPFTQA